MKRQCLFLILILQSLLQMQFALADSKQEQEPKGKGFEVKDLLKSDIDKVLEVNVEVIDELLEELMRKLYLRNPEELEKSPFLNAEECIHKLFSYSPEVVHSEFMQMSGGEALRLSFENDYEGDRVFSFVAGLRTMIF